MGYLLKDSFSRVVFTGVSVFFGLILSISFSAAADPLGYWNFENVDTSGATVLNLGSAGNSWDALWNPFSGTPSFSDALVATPWGTGLLVNASLGSLELPISSTESFTLETWVKSTQPTWSASSSMISCRTPNGMILHPTGDHAWRGFTGYIYDKDGNARVDGTGPWYQPGGGIVYDVAQWHHYAMTYDNVTGYAAVYVDGRLLGGSNLSIPREAGVPQTLWVGQNDTAWRNEIQNSVFDEIRYYDSALGARAVRESYLERFNPTLPRGMKVGMFFSAADLDLDTSNGTFAYAVNLAGSQAWNIGGVTFRTEADSGLAGAFSGGFKTWGYGDDRKPNFGAGTDNDNLAEMCRSVRYLDSGSFDSATLTLDVTPGQTYQLQLLATTLEGSRMMTLSLGGKQVLDNFNHFNLQTFDGNRTTNGIVLTYEFMTMNDKFVIEGIRGTDYGISRDFILNALTLKALDNPLPHAPMAIPLTSVENLRLDRGIVVYAVNVNGGEVTVTNGSGSVAFTADAYVNRQEGISWDPVTKLYDGKVSIKSTSLFGAGWAAGKPSSPNLNSTGLDTLLGTIRAGGGTTGIELALAVTPGMDYELDLFFHDTFAEANKRGFDVFLNGDLLIEGFDITAIALTADAVCADAMLTIPFTASDNIMELLLRGNASFGNQDPILAGFMLRNLSGSEPEDNVPEPTTWGMLLFGVAGGIFLLGSRRRPGGGKLIHFPFSRAS